MLTLQEHLRCPYLMVTLSEKGVMMLHNGVFTHLPAHPRNIVDVSGAGDTVLSVAALCVAALRRDALNASPALDASAQTIAALANIAGGMVCEEVGVTPINKQRFTEEVLRLCHD